MLTYDLDDKDTPIYLQLYDAIKSDITDGTLSSGDKLPSRRTFAANLGISTVTVDNAYDQLLEEGYIYSLPKKGYFVASLSAPALQKSKRKEIFVYTAASRKSSRYYYNFSKNSPDPSNFPFSVWARLSRNVISNRSRELLQVSPGNGVMYLRKAIARHLSSFRGMNVSPDQIVIGAGTEYLYSLIIKLLGKDKHYCLENPGYKKIKQVYESEGISPSFAELDSEGIIISDFEKSRADVVHISPNHHFPTGITTPINRRYELLSWAFEKAGRYIIEDDYDSEFRFRGTPIPTLQSIDTMEKVIYLNTFSKSLTSTIRISYMVLPPHLAREYYKRLSFLSCTVSTYDQYTLGEFIDKGYLEKHINRMRIRYGKKRDLVFAHIRDILGNEMTAPDGSTGGYIIKESDSGLHFILKLFTDHSDSEVAELLLDQKVRITPVSEYYIGSEKQKESSLRNNYKGEFIFDYSSIDIDRLPAALTAVKRVLTS